MIESSKVETRKKKQGRGKEQQLVDLEDAYFDDIKNFGRISKKEERILLKKIQSAKDEFYSCLLNHNESIKFIYDVYSKYKDSYLKLYKYFKLASGGGRSISKDDVKNLFVKNMKIIKSILDSNKADYNLLRRQAKLDNQQRKVILSRIDNRIKKAVSLVDELGFRSRKLVEKKFQTYETIQKTIHQYDNSKTRQKDLESNPLLQYFRRNSYDINELRNYLDKLIPLHDKYVSLRNEMMEANLRLVISYARKLSNRWLSYPDAIQAGNLGLLKAIEKYDLSYNYCFSTYATYWIKQAIARTRLYQRGSCYLNQRIGLIMKEYDRMYKELERNPSAEEVAKKLGVKTFVVERAIRLYRLKTYSLDAHFQNNNCNNDNSSYDPEDKSQTIEDEIKALRVSAIVNDAIKELSESEQASSNIKLLRNCVILLMRYNMGNKELKSTLEDAIQVLPHDDLDVKGTTLRELSKALGLSRERIRQVVVNIEKKLKPLMIKRKELADYLPYVEENMSELDDSAESEG